MRHIAVRSRIPALAVALLMAAAAMGVSAPQAAAAQPDLVWYLDRTFREVVDLGQEGDSVGDITIANGTISTTRGGKAVGQFALTQITSIVIVRGAEQRRSGNLAMIVGDDAIYTTQLDIANASAPPQGRVVHAIIGGTGKYSGVRGEMVLKPLSYTRYKLSFYFVP